MILKNVVLRNARQNFKKVGNYCKDAFAVCAIEFFVVHNLCYVYQLHIKKCTIESNWTAITFKCCKFSELRHQVSRGWSRAQLKMCNLFVLTFNKCLCIWLIFAWGLLLWSNYRTWNCESPLVYHILRIPNC